MPAKNPQVFKFEVDNQGVFRYDPVGTWDYVHGHRVRFETKTGPFTISFQPTGGIMASEFNPLKGPLKSKPPVNGIHVAETKAEDPFTDSERKMIIKSHIEADHDKGFITAYQYVIDVTDANGRSRHDDHKNGSFSC